MGAGLAEVGMGLAEKREKKGRGYIREKIQRRGGERPDKQRRG